MAIPAIPTSYAGRFFRSRLEARWAVFYDALGISWVYEPEGFALKAGWYLPDFYIPHLECYIEIKPRDPSDDESEKAHQLASVTDKNVYIFTSPEPGHQWPPCYPRGQPSGNGAYLYDTKGYDEGRMWCQCPRCGFFGIEFQGRADRLPCSCLAWSNREFYGDIPVIRSAYDRANSERFVL